MKRRTYDLDEKERSLKQNTKGVRRGGRGREMMKVGVYEREERNKECDCETMVGGRNIMKWVWSADLTKLINTNKSIDIVKQTTVGWIHNSADKRKKIMKPVLRSSDPS